jgi:hypothetical protein
MNGLVIFLLFCGAGVVVAAIGALVYAAMDLLRNG